MPRCQRFRRDRLIPIVPFLAAFLLAAAAGAASAQQQFEWPSHPGNIKVLPKKMAPEQLRDVMVGFTQALGVRCNHCHVGEEGKPLTTFDFQSDAKQQKRIARDMVRMVGDVNKDLGKMKLTDEPRVTVRCATCHHGHARPTTLGEELMMTYDRSGIDSTLAAYQALRTRYYGRDAYDFSESGLADFGTALAKKGRTDDAIRIHQLNVQQYPQSLRAYGPLAQAYEAAGRKQEAADTYRKMLEIDPQNPNLRRRLDELQGAGSR